jgi:hypothetical protein
MMVLRRSLVLAFFGALFVSVSGYAADEVVPARLEKQKLSFSYSGFRSAYSCSYVESQTEKVLKALGAQNVSVRCSGGLEDRSETVFIRAQFSSVRETTADKSTRTASPTPVTFKFDESCDLHVRIIRSALKKFEVYAEDNDSSCYNWQGRVNYGVVVLK